MNNTYFIIKLLSLILAVLMLLPLVLTACRGDSPTIPNDSSESSSESESESGQDVIPTKTEYVVKEYYKSTSSYLGTFHCDEMDNQFPVYPNRNKENPYMGELNILGYTVYPKEWIKEYAYYDRSKTLDVYYGITAVDYIEKIYVDSQTHEVIGFSVNLSDNNIKRFEWLSPKKSDEELEEQAWEWFKAQTDDYASYELTTRFIASAANKVDYTTFTFRRWIGGVKTVDYAEISISPNGRVVGFFKAYLGIAQNFSLDYNIDLDAVYQAVHNKAMSIYGYLMSISENDKLIITGPKTVLITGSGHTSAPILCVLDGHLVLEYDVIFYYDADKIHSNDTTLLYAFVD